MLNHTETQGSVLEKCPIPILAKSWQTDSLLMYSFAFVFMGYWNSGNGTEKKSR